MRIAINPSTQFHNAGICGDYIEGYAMGRMGQRVVDLLNQYGAPSIEAKLFWNGPEGGDDYIGNTNDAIAWGCNYLVSFHTDSAGNKNNDGRGYTGSLLCYSGAVGRQLGASIQAQMNKDFGWPIAGDSYRPELAVMKAPGSLLLEIGNHSDPEDCVALRNNPAQFEHAIAWGIFAYLGIDPKGKDLQEDDMRDLFEYQGKVWYCNYDNKTRYNVPKVILDSLLHKGMQITKLKDPAIIDAFDVI